jgi:hypothetical protein
MQELNGFGRAPPVQIALLSACAQHGCSIRDILGMLQSPRGLQLCAVEGRRELGDEFRESVVTHRSVCRIGGEPRLGLSSPTHCYPSGFSSAAKRGVKSATTRLKRRW